MKQLFDFFPILLFFIVYKFYLDLPDQLIITLNNLFPFMGMQPGESRHAIYLATLVAILATIIQVALTALVSKKVEKMHIVTLLLLIVLMVGALSSGFPVAFALPGSAILSIAIAALCGWLFVGDTDAFFSHGGPNQWLSAGVTNFRSLYWVVERDTLIAIPLFVFMGIMLQRSRIAEDLLVAMASTVIKIGRASCRERV